MSIALFRKGALFRKYMALFMAVVTIALASSGLFTIWLTYQETTAALIQFQRGQAELAVSKIAQFFKEIEGQLGWTTQLPWTAAALESRRFDGRFRLS